MSAQQLHMYLDLLWMSRKHASHLEEKAVALGRKIGRMGDMWYSFRTIFEHALDRQATLEDIGYTEGCDHLHILIL